MEVGAEISFWTVPLCYIVFYAVPFTYVIMVLHDVSFYVLYREKIEERVCVRM